MYNSNRTAYRQTYYGVWQKYKQQHLLQPLEEALLRIILLHPEFQAILENPEQFADEEFRLDENPFFHMSLHLGVREQVATNRPLGIQQVYKRLLLQHQDEHLVEHMIMECLAQALWEAQQNGVMGDEQSYLEKVQRL